MCSPIWRACVSDLTVFLEEENVSCLSRLAGSPRSRGVGLLSRRLVLLKQIPHISIKQQLCFGTALKTDPGGHWCPGVCRRIEAATHFAALLFPSSLKEAVVVSHRRSQLQLKSSIFKRNSCSLVLNLNLEQLPEILERRYGIIVYPLICLYLLLLTEVHIFNGMPKHTWRMCAQMCSSSCTLVRVFSFLSESLIEQSSSVLNRVVPWQEQ